MAFPRVPDEKLAACIELLNRRPDPYPFHPSKGEALMRYGDGGGGCVKPVGFIGRDGAGVASESATNSRPDLLPNLSERLTRSRNVYRKAPFP
jgi:hypothetical protein